MYEYLSVLAMVRAREFGVFWSLFIWILESYGELQYLSLECMIYVATMLSVLKSR